MPYVNLPPGCRSLSFADGGKPVRAAREGGRVEVSESRARAINAMTGNGTAGLINASPGTFIGTKKGRWCAACKRLWNVWSTECPKCGGATEAD